MYMHDVVRIGVNAHVNMKLTTHNLFLHKKQICCGYSLELPHQGVLSLSHKQLGDGDETSVCSLIRKTGQPEDRTTDPWIATPAH